MNVAALRSGERAPAAAHSGFRLSSTGARTLVVLAVAAAAVAGAATTLLPASGHAVADAGADLTRLLRAMAGLKALMAGAAAWAVLWRLGAPATLPWLAGYTLAAAAMAAGPGMIWSMEYIRSGALLLHAGLFVTIVMLWRDPVVGQRLGDVIAKRRSKASNLRL
jgi:hypothetical protein